jgi:hypothetical protein
MTRRFRHPLRSALVLALAVWWTAAVWAQAPVADLVRAVQANPSVASQVVAQAVAAGQPEDAAGIVGAVVAALQPTERRTLAPTVVSAAIAALPATQRTPYAPSLACAAIRAVPAAEQPTVVPAVVSAAIALAPQARPQIVACAIEAAPTLAAMITTAAGGALAAQFEGSSAPSTPLPGSSIGVDSTLVTRQSCASPPCP